ncbi:MAG TPA: hypothetical protein VNI02_17170 [Blastocatellia bacterium]|jgi:hypothetical protein|nr:hypothetical protein [Blastocatellia bacterium]
MTLLFAFFIELFAGLGSLTALLLLNHQAELFQTVTGPLAELPGWLQAAGWGAMSASGLLIGAAGGYYTPLQHTAIARAMTFAAGVLLAVVAVDLVINARGAVSLHWTVTGMLCGAAVFSSVNWLLSRRGARHRKRCGECVQQPEEEQQPGSGLAIAAGGPGNGRGVRGGRDPGAGLGNDDPGGVPRLAAVQRPAAGRRFCGLTDLAGTRPLKALLEDSVMPGRLSKPAD